SGSTVSGLLGSSKCYVNASGSVRSVAFTMDSSALNTDSAPTDGMQCALDTTKFANGTHQLKAVVTGTDGSTKTDIISVNVQNSATPTPTPAPTLTPSPTPSPTPTPTSSTTTPTAAPGSGSLDVWFKAPVAGATVKGLLNAGTSCWVNG